MYAGARAREIWAPRINAFNSKWERLEWLTVAEGIRSGALTFCRPEDLPKKTRELRKYGLEIVTLNVSGSGTQYTASSSPVVAGKAWNYRVGICKQGEADAWVNAWGEDSPDNELVGQLLGYPDCCRHFFERIWVAERWVDTTWPMAENTGAGMSRLTFQDAEALMIHGALGPEANILGRWLGIRYVPWLPCAFDCKRTIALATEFSAVAQDAGLWEAMAPALELLNAPIEWSALHGCGELKFPVLKISFRTDATAEKYVVRFTGEAELEGAVTGTVFPYRRQAGNVLTESKSYRKAFEGNGGKDPDDVLIENLRDAGAAVIRIPLAEVLLPDPRDWSDNGFSSREAMDTAHAALLAVTSEIVAGPVLDLGCGNGSLLEKLVERTPIVRPHGIELDQDRVDRARDRMPEAVISCGSMFDPAMWELDHYSLVYFMPGRILELDLSTVPGRAKRSALRRLLLDRADRLVVYAYGDWLKDRDLEAIIEEAGLWDGWNQPERGHTSADGNAAAMFLSPVRATLST